MFRKPFSLFFFSTKLFFFLAKYKHNKAFREFAHRRCRCHLRHVYFRLQQQQQQQRPQSPSSLPEVSFSSFSHFPSLFPLSKLLRRPSQPSVMHNEKKSPGFLSIDTRTKQLKLNGGKEQLNSPGLKVGKLLFSIPSCRGARNKRRRKNLPSLCV